MIKNVRKRDDRIVPFDQSKITHAISRALFDARIADGKRAKKLSDNVVEILAKKFPRAIPNVETIQNIVEEILAAKIKNRNLIHVYNKK